MSWQLEFNKILNKIIARKDSEFFREPVKWEELELFDYPKIIKTPMVIKYKLTINIIFSYSLSFCY
jgi:hypothetical protein